MDRKIYINTIARLVDDFEGYETLALVLNVNVEELRRWAEGRARPPTDVFLRIVNLDRHSGGPT